MNVQKVLCAAEDKLVLICSDAVYLQTEKSYEKFWSVPDAGKNHLLPLGAMSQDGSMVAVCDALKKVYRLSLADGSILREYRVEKAPTSVTFGAGDDLYVADRSGDITLAGSSIIAGHVSMVTDICTAANGSLLISSDRDEKLRLTCLEAPYPIEAFLLGHTAYVAAACEVEAGIVSVSGDGTARLWATNASGSEQKDNLLATFEFDKETFGRLALIQKVVSKKEGMDEDDGDEEAEEVEEEIEETEALIFEPLAIIKTGKNNVAVLFDNSNKIAFLSIDANAISLDQTIALPEGHVALSASHDGTNTFILAWHLDHACLFKQDLELVCEYPKADAMPEVWKGVWRKDCHGMFARRLKSKRAKQDDASDDE